MPGDIIELRLGDIVQADVRLLEVSGLECDESVLTGESLTVDRSSGAVAPGTPLAELAGCALTGTIVHAGSGRGAVVATRARTEFGAIATGLDTRQVDTGPQLLPAKVRSAQATARDPASTCPSTVGSLRVRRGGQNHGHQRCGDPACGVDVVGPGSVQEI